MRARRASAVLAVVLAVVACGGRADPAANPATATTLAADLAGQEAFLADAAALGVGSRDALGSASAVCDYLGSPGSGVARGSRGSVAAVSVASTLSLDLAAANSFVRSAVVNICPENGDTLPP